MVKGKKQVLNDIVGGFNYPEIDWANGTSPLDSTHKATLFLEIVRDSFVLQHLSKPTHFRSDQQPNVLDLIFTLEENMISNLAHLAPLGKSHHQVLNVTISAK